MKTYLFTITLCGDGENPDEAWRDACEGFELDPGETPESYYICGDKANEPNREVPPEKADRG